MNIELNAQAAFVVEELGIGSYADWGWDPS